MLHFSNGFSSVVANMKFTLLFVAILCVIQVFQVQSLECGIDSTSSQKDLKKIAETCMKTKIEEKKKPISEDGDDDEDEQKESTTESLKRTKRNPASDDDNTKDDEYQKESTTEIYKRSKRNDPDKNTQNSQNQNEELIPTENNNNNNSSSKNCVMQCIFGQLGMTDGNGFPVHHRLSDALLRTAKTRELRDFIQDTTDECFQLMEQGDHQDSCTYSVTLVNCLAERGKSNCADWPIGNLSFLTNKN